MDVTVPGPLLLIGCSADRLHDPANRDAAPNHAVVVGVADASDEGGAQGKFVVAHISEQPTKNWFVFPGQTSGSVARHGSRLPLLAPGGAVLGATRSFVMRRPSSIVP